MSKRKEEQHKITWGRVETEEMARHFFQSTTVSIDDTLLVVVGGPHRGLSLPLDREILHIGREEWCDLVLHRDLLVSANHCMIQLSNKGVRVIDQGSRNGIFLAGQEVLDAYLVPGVKVQLGETILELRSSEHRKEIEVHYFDGSGLLLGRSKRMREIFSLMSRIARRDMPVLLTGETGTGKTRLAQAIHLQSSRASKPFVVVNCGALTASMIEAALFGYEKGAFTDAKALHHGYFEQAHQGTLFLDEIGELPLDLQPKLLDVVERRRLRRIGGEKEIEVDFRLLTATNRNLFQEMVQGRFRQDLLYRLSVIKLEVPPLRDRREDIPLLIQWLIRQLQPGSPLELTDAARQKLEEYVWPGNVRELRNVLECAVAFLEGEVIDADDLFLASLEEEIDSNEQTSLSSWGAPLPLSIDFEQEASLKKIMERIERLVLQQAFEKNEGNVSRTAQMLQISRGWLYKKMEKYGLSGG